MLFAAFFLITVGTVNYFVADYLDKNRIKSNTASIQQLVDDGLAVQSQVNDQQDSKIAQLVSDQLSNVASYNQLQEQVDNQPVVSNPVIVLDGNTLTKSSAGLRVSSDLVGSMLTTSALFGGDVTGNYSGLSVINDSHGHTADTISGLTIADFNSANISQWTNDIGYIKLTDDFVNTLLTDYTNFGGDVSGSYDGLSIVDDSHNHTGSSISGLSVNDFSSANISQWTNNSGYLTNSSAFVNGGNAFGEAASIGTDDNYSLALQTNGSEVMSLLANGNVGIGQTNPTSKLDVNDVLTSNGLVSTFTRNNKTLGLYSDSASFSIGTETNNGLSFYTNGNTNRKMMLDTSGRLGIGTDNPGARLEINSGTADVAGLKFTQINSSTATQTE